METAYAQALWQMVEGGMTAPRAIHALKALLERDGKLALLPRIGKAFARIAEREAASRDVVLTVAREADERKARHAAKEVLSSLGIDSSDLKTQVDDSLIGGWRLEGRETLVDASYKKQLLDLYNRAVSA